MLRKNSTLLYIHLIFTSSISVSFAQIDWHDFVVVETIDFPVDEAGDLPPPVTPDELGARLIAQERYERMKVRCFFLLLILDEYRHITDFAFLQI